MNDLDLVLCDRPVTQRIYYQTETQDTGGASEYYCLGVVPFHPITIAEC